MYQKFKDNLNKIDIYNHQQMLISLAKAKFDRDEEWKFLKNSFYTHEKEYSVDNIVELRNLFLLNMNNDRSFISYLERKSI